MLLPPDLNSPLWDTYGNQDWDPQPRFGFLGDDEIDYGITPTAVMKTKEEEEGRRSQSRGISQWAKTSRSRRSGTTPTTTSVSLLGRPTFQGR
jgi:hypothetical protein